MFSIFSILYFYSIYFYFYIFSYLINTLLFTVIYHLFSFIFFNINNLTCLVILNNSFFSIYFHFFISFFLYLCLFNFITILIVLSIFFIFIFKVTYINVHNLYACFISACIIFTEQKYAYLFNQMLRCFPLVEAM